MKPRLLVCATIAMLSAASAGLVGACSSGDCSETLTCDDAATEGGEDGTVDSPIDVGSDTGMDVTVDAPGDTSVDGPDAGDAADGADGASDARDSSADAGDGASDAPSDALDASDARDAPADVVEAAAVCGAPFTCTPAVPTGFTGPVAFVQEAPAAGDAPAPPACASPYTVQAVNGVNDPLVSPPTCTCACGAVDGGCSVSNVQTFLDNVCVNRCNAVNAPTCTPSGCGSNSQSAIVSVPVPMGGACTESVTKTVPPWNAAQDWGVTGRACATSSTLPEGGCTGTEICAPAPPSAFGIGLCVYQSGTQTCPSTYPNQHLFYASGTDTRTCLDGCSCGSPAGVSCSVVGSVSANSTCAGASLLFADAGSCATFPSLSPPFFVNATVTPSGGSCAPAGTATPSGGVSLVGPVTVCCAN